ncbi:MAG TPA: response regulator, partial [Oculatellaceae cyanobacterium]
MVQQVPILIIDEDPAARALIRTTLSEVQGIEVLAETDSLVYGYELIRHNRPKMVFIDLRNDPAKTLDVVKRISSYYKETLVVASGTDINFEMLKACMEAGVRDYLPRPLQAQDIKSVLEKHRLALTVDVETGDRSGRIITVFSNKGGLGKTTIAVNLAISLSEAIRRPVVLVDLNLQLGDITTFLDIEPKQTIVDIARNIGRVDQAYLEGSLAQYTCPANGATVY